jgi:hypothetical protein
VRDAGVLRASVVSAACLVRGFPLFFAAQPRTPLRVLGIVAFDTLHVLRYRRLLPRTRIRELAAFLDLQGCANAAWDRKDLCDGEFQATQQRLEHAGLGDCIEAYLSRLRELESHRPSIGGDRRRFDDVRPYREAVVRLSIATAAAIALNAERFEDEIRAAQLDSDVDTLFRVLMQCQIIDDVLDHGEDLFAGLPSFLTASASPAEALEFTAEAARDYGANARHDAVFPLRVALLVFTVVTTLVVRVARWRELESFRQPSRMQTERPHLRRDSPRTPGRRSGNRWWR